MRIIRKVLLLALCGVLVLNTAAFAQSADGPAPEATPYDISNNIIFIGGEGLTCDQQAGNSPLRGADNTEKAFWYFIDKGLKDFQSAGIVGNLLVESAFTMDPTIKQGGGGPGRGIVQWEMGGRWDTDMFGSEPANVLDYAHDGIDQSIGQKIGIDWESGRSEFDLKTQLDFLWYELNIISPWKNALPPIRSSSDVYEAAALFMTEFEKPRDQSVEAQRKRGEIAKTQVLDVYGGGVITSRTDGGSGCATSGGVAIVDGFAFPLSTTKKVILDNSPRWCYDNHSNCHHDYNAADIFVPTGTQVVAAEGGRIVNPNNGTAARVTIVAEKYTYYYNHMAAGSLDHLRHNSPIGTGDPLGTIGTEEDAWNTPTHLHFDMLPRPPHESRVSCSASACGGYPFLNVQPLLIKSYEALADQ